MSEIFRRITRRTDMQVSVPQENELISGDLVGRLLNEANTKFGGDNFKSHEQYTKGIQNKFAVPLPHEYTPLLLGANSADYHMVSYLDYRNRQHRNQGDERQVTLSISHTQAAAGDHLRELEYKRVEGKSTLEIREFINGSQHHKLGENLPSTFFKPEGKATATYELQPTGEKKLKSAFVSRVDDVVLQNRQGHAKAGRWSRTFSIHDPIHHDTDIFSPIEYTDHYWLEGKERETATVNFKVDGTLEDPKKITIQIGNFGGNKELAKSLSRRVRIITSDSYTDEENQLALLQQEPSYDFLFKNGKLKRPSLPQVREFLIQRINQLQHDWDNPNNIFLGSAIESAPTDLAKIDPFAS